MKKYLATIALIVMQFGCSNAKIDLNNTIDILDNTSKYKGKTLNVEGYFMADFKHNNKRSDLVTINFRVISNAGAFDLTLHLPPNLNVPQIEMGHSFKITFICKEGSLQYGNEVSKIERIKH